MRGRKLTRVGVAALLISGALFLWALYLRGPRRLCNGYRLMWMNGAEAVIVDTGNNEVVTRGTVTRYAAQCPFITGYTSKAGFPPETYPVEGYFFINSESGYAQLGLTEAEWAEQLRTAHWGEPQLRETHVLLPSAAQGK